MINLATKTYRNTTTQQHNTTPLCSHVINFARLRRLALLISRKKTHLPPPSSSSLLRFVRLHVFFPHPSFLLSAEPEAPFEPLSAAAKCSARRLGPGRRSTWLRFRRVRRRMKEPPPPPLGGFALGGAHVRPVERSLCPRWRWEGTE